MIHCDHYCNIGFLYLQYRCSFLDTLEELIPKKKRSLLGIEKFIKQLQKGDELNGIVLDKINQKDIVTDEVGVPNDVIHV